MQLGSEFESIPNEYYQNPENEGDSDEFDAFVPFPEDLEDEEEEIEKTQLTEEFLLQNLNEYQKKAVQHFRGPIQILAAAGSGKTRVITRRIANLIHKGIKPWQILGVTFTNKAAQEMNKRIENLVDADGLTLCTFHSFCVRIIRAHAELLGLERDFVIFDRDYQKSAMKKVLKKLNLDPSIFNPMQLLQKISRLKSKGYNPADLSTEMKGLYETNTVQAFGEYQQFLSENNAVDFDDLLLLGHKLFSNHKDVLEIYRKRYRFVLVDEFQDTNRLQYDLVKFLTIKHKNICVTGDPDQAIYSWRGADIGNMTSFEKDFPGAASVLLPKNYRSTGKILQAADSLIEHNVHRKPKRMITDNARGENIEVRKLWSESDEATYICKKLVELNADKYRYGDCAIFYRINAQSRELEKKLIENGIPYTIVKGLEFYQRKEIKDILAYLNVIHNSRDVVSLLRIVNTPTRGIGAKTLSNISDFAVRNQETFDKIFWTLPAELKIPDRARRAIKSFIKFVQEVRGLAEDKTPVGNIINYVIQAVKYKDYLERTDILKAESRIENIEELITDADKFELANEGSGIGEYLEQVALISDADKFDQNVERVSLLTFHTAKGLEFPVVFMVGMEDNIFPHQRVFEEDRDLEEERRLCYVGITRAERLLYLTCCESRTFLGKTAYNEPSRFLTELDPEVVTFYNALNELTPFSAATLMESNSPKWGKEKSSDSNNYYGSKYQNYGNNYKKKPAKKAEDASSGYTIDYDDESSFKKKPSKKTRGTAHKVQVQGEVMLEPDDFSDFRKGDRIFHDSFGKGVIENLSGSGISLKAKIYFDSVGVKTIVLSYVKLKRLM